MSKTCSAEKIPHFQLAPHTITRVSGSASGSIWSAVLYNVGFDISRRPGEWLLTKTSRFPRQFITAMEQATAFYVCLAAPQVLQAMRRYESTRHLGGEAR